MSKLGNIGIHEGARRRISLALMAALGTLSLGAHAEGAHTRHVHAEIEGGQAQMVGTPEATQVMNLDIVLPLRDPSGLTALAAGHLRSASPKFRHYITPAEFTERFGPTQADYDAVRATCRNGLKVTGGSATAWTCRCAAPRQGRERLPRHDAQLQASDREPHFLLAGPRAHDRPGHQAVARLGHGQLLHSPTQACQAQ